MDAVKEREVETEVELVGALPLQFRVAHRLVEALQRRLAIGIVGIGCAGGQTGKRLVVANLLVTCDTIATTNLQFGDHLVIFQEVFLRSTPCKTH